MKTRTFEYLLLLPLCVLLGCHQELSPAAAMAAEEQTLASQLESDHASILFAQQESVLAHTSTAARGATAQAAAVDSEQQAQTHLEAADMLLKMDEDRAQVQRDARAWKSFALQAKSSQKH